MKEDVRLGVVLLFSCGCGLGIAISVLVVGLYAVPQAWLLIVLGLVGALASLGLGGCYAWVFVRDCEACEAALKLLAATPEPRRGQPRRIRPCHETDAETIVSGNCCRRQKRVGESF